VHAELEHGLPKRERHAPAAPRDVDVDDGQESASHVEFVQRMQAIHGNRWVQRFVGSRAQEGSIQRDADDDATVEDDTGGTQTTGTPTPARVSYPTSLPGNVTRQAYQYLHHSDSGKAKIYVDTLVFEFANPSDNQTVSISVQLTDLNGNDLGSGSVTPAPGETDYIQFNGFPEPRLYVLNYAMTMENVDQPNQNTNKPVPWATYT
jgi:hypothetical protein